MDYKIILLFLVLSGIQSLKAQHEDIPYQDVDKICETCICLSAQDADKRFHHMLSCAVKNFKHILAHWPQEFGKNHNGVDIVATFSGNSIDILQQLPATNATLSFSCRHCGIKHIQAPTFMDVPYLKRLDLSWNEITTDELTPSVFRGPYRATRYEPIALTNLDLSHNQLHALDKKLFEHTPNITKLNLAYNPLKVLDNPTIMALASASSLESLDLSYTGIKYIVPTIFKSLVNLKWLNLAANEFVAIPDSLKLIGKTLETLNLAGNHFKNFSEQNFMGLTALKRLNISDMPPLKKMDNGTFAHLESLEYLYCSHNPQLDQFNMDSLLHCTNLTHLDISYCSITTLSLTMDSPKTVGNNATNSTTVSKPWTKLHTFDMVANPWHCDCDLLQLLEYAGSHYRYGDTEIRCETPYMLAGALLSNITAEKICSMQMPKKFKAIDEDPPRFLRKRYIILTLITAAVVIVIGLIIGFLVGCVRRRLKRADFGVEPIRYTSVRSSNLSAFSHVNPSNGISSSNA